MISQGASKVSHLINLILHSSLSMSNYKLFHPQTQAKACMHPYCLYFVQVNISLVVNDSEAEQCVRALHEAFFESEHSELEKEYKNGNGSVAKLS